MPAVTTVEAVVEAIVDDELLDREQVAARVGIEPASVTRYLVRGGFPEPDRRFGRSPAWFASTVDRWLQSRPGQGAGGGRPRKEPVPEHVVTVERREGVRGPQPAPSFRWACSCGETGRWTRQPDTAETGGKLHPEKAAAK